MMSNFYNQYIKSPACGFIHDNRIFPDNSIEISISGISCSLTLQDKNLTIYLKTLAAATNTFHNENKDEYVFFEPQLILKPNERQLSMKICMVEKEKYEKFKEANND